MKANEILIGNYYLNLDFIDSEEKEKFFQNDLVGKIKYLVNQKEGALPIEDKYAPSLGDFIVSREKQIYLCNNEYSALHWAKRIIKGDLMGLLEFLEKNRNERRI